MFATKTVSALVLALALTGGAIRGEAATIDLGFALDSSGSIGGTDFALATQGLASALGQIPTSGDDTYTLSVVTFTTSATTIIPPTVVTAANLALLQSTVAAISYSGGGTAIDSGIDLLTSLFLGAGLGDSSLFNVTTDGQSNFSALQASATAAALAGIDGLSYEAVGGGVDVDALLGTAFPGTPVLVTDGDDLPDPFQTSFVIAVDSFDDYEAAITAKIGAIVAVPVPAALPLLVTALGALGGAGAMRRRRAA